MSDEEQWKARILVNSSWDMFVTPLNDRTSKVIFLIQQKLSEEELALPFDGALYVPSAGLRSLSTKRFDEEVEMFEKFIRFVDGLEGKCLAFWVEVHDWDLKDRMFEKLRLKERNCEWCWDYVHWAEKDNDLHLRLCQFFEENTTQQRCQIKPAKEVMMN